MTRRLTDRQVSALSDIAWATHYFAGMTSSGKNPKRRLDDLVTKGLVVCTGLGEPRTSDGFLIQGRVPRLGYRLTLAGLDALEERDKTLPSECRRSILAVLKSEKP
jgi:hypothetical protein